MDKTKKIKDKAAKVIESCTTPEQLQTAKIYALLAEKEIREREKLLTIIIPKEPA